MCVISSLPPSAWVLLCAMAWAPKPSFHPEPPLPSAIFTADIDDKLDNKVKTMLWLTGHSRVPIYDRNARNIVGVLTHPPCAP